MNSLKDILEKVVREEEMRTCSVCGREISKRDICNDCYKKWGNQGNYPLWLRELIRIHSAYERNYASRELTFTDLGLSD